MPNLLRLPVRFLGFVLLALGFACGGGGGNNAGPGTTAPVFTTHPQSLTVSLGASAAFAVAATGSPAPAFQWRKNGTPIPGATASAFQIPAAQLTDSGTYDAVATNTAGSATSNPAVLTVQGPPNQAPSTPVIVGPTTAITVHPAFYNLSSVDPEGDPITFLVNGTAITGNSFRLDPIAAGTTTLSVQARDNRTPPATSGTATLTVNVAANRPPQFLSSPNGQTTGTTPAITWTSFQVAAQDPDTDEVVLSILGAPTFADVISGAVVIAPGGAVSFTGILAAGKTTGSASFTVKAEDRLPGTSTLLGASATQAITLIYTLVAPTAPAITSQPQGLSVQLGQLATFSLTATGTPPLAYQWHRNGQALAGASGSTFTIASAAFTDAGAYTVMVSNGAGSVTSNAATLQVNAPTGGTNILLNPGFEDGRTVWGSNDPANIIDDSPAPAHSGTWKAWLGGWETVRTDTLHQVFTIPAAATSAVLGYWLRTATEETGTAAVDLLTVELRHPDTDALVATLSTYSNLDAGTAYQLKQFDLTAFRGQRLRLHLTGVMNLGLATSWLLDDFSLSVLSPSGLAPSISGFTPLSGPPGSTVTVSGGGFWGISSVTLNGVPAAFVAQSANQLLATVPVTTSGLIAINTTAGTATSATPFTVILPAPTLTQVSPGSGPVGTPVVLTGTNLTGATAVRFNSIAAAFTVTNPTRIGTTVPAGATSGFVTVETPGGTATSPAPFTVTVGGPSLDLAIDSLYITQGSQTYGRAVPLLKGRPGFLRVFGRANLANAVAPSVRVRIFNGPALINTYFLPSPGSSVPTSLSEGNLNQSWNLSLPASEIQAGYGIIADIDSGGTVVEADETNNLYPVNGVPLLLNPLQVQPLRPTIIPVTQSGLTGNATAGNLAAWTNRAERMFPLETVETQLGTPYTTSNVLLAEGGGWESLLSELEAKRITEGQGTSRYYFGAVATGYTSGVAGMGYVPGSSASTSGRSALGWDKTGYSDGGNYPEVYAHELGHNFGRAHAPCGGVANPDPGFPYLGGDIGVYGYDVPNNQLKAPGSFKDIMGYCSPNWISDYTYAAMLAWRQSDAVHLPPPGDENGAAAQESLLVWGRLERGSWTLEPAFPVAVPPQAPEAGDCVAEGFDGSGKRLFSVSFGLLAVGCGRGDEGDGLFNLVIPLESAVRAQVTRIVVSRNGLAVAERRASPLAHLSPARPVAARMSADGTDLVWDEGAYPMAAVRDPLSGEILAFARGGFITLPGAKRELEVLLSDGVQAVRQRLHAAE